jgi:hypothetical protein
VMLFNSIEKNGVVYYGDRSWFGYAYKPKENTFIFCSGKLN